MVRISSVVVIAAATSLAFLPAALRTQSVPAGSQEAIEETIRAVHAQLKEAAEKLDAAALYAHVLDTDTPPIIEDGLLLPTHAAALANTAAGLRGVTRMSYAYTRQDITVISPTTALWVAEGTAAATLRDGREIAGPFAESVVFVQRDGEWQILHAHRSAPQR